MHFQGQSWHLGGQKGRENGGRCPRANGEVISGSERLQQLTSEAASGDGLPQNRLLRAMPACSTFPVFPNTRPQSNVIFRGDVRRARGAVSCFYIPGPSRQPLSWDMPQPKGT